MKKPLVTLPLGAVAFLLVVAPVYTYCIKVDDLLLKVIAPKTYSTGELITLDASESILKNLAWTIIPDTANFKINGNRAYFSSPNKETYTIVLAGTDGNIVRCLLFTLKWKTEENEEEVDLFTEKMEKWLPENFDKGTALKLAQSFRSIASISKNSFNDLEAMLLATAYSNKVALGNDFSVWKPFLDQLSSDLEVTTIADCAKKWNQIADSLENLI